MNSLQDAVIRRRAEESTTGPLCHRSKSNPLSLTVRTADGAHCLLPWLHFAYGWHGEDEDGEYLRLVFASHEVLARGARLHVLAEEAAQHRLDRLHAIPEKYDRSAHDNEPVVTHLRVTAIDEGPAEEPSGKSGVSSA